MKHTKGPWHFEPEIAYGWDVRGENCWICSVNNSHDNSPGFPRGLEGRANAELIAAVPDLLEALEGLFEQCTMTHKFWGDNDNLKAANNAIKAAKDAIKKATGG